MTSGYLFQEHRKHALGLSEELHNKSTLEEKQMSGSQSVLTSRLKFFCSLLKKVKIEEIYFCYNVNRIFVSLSANVLDWIVILININTNTILRADNVDKIVFKNTETAT